MLVIGKGKHRHVVFAICLSSDIYACAYIRLNLPLFVIINLSICSPAYRVARKLAAIGDELNRNHRRQFQGMVDELNLTENNAYEQFADVVQRYFVVYTYQSTLGNDIPNEEYNISAINTSFNQLPLQFCFNASSYDENYLILWEEYDTKVML